jgi:hypothetical protein
VPNRMLLPATRFQNRPRKRQCRRDAAFFVSRYYARESTVRAKKFGIFFRNLGVGVIGFERLPNRTEGSQLPMECCQAFRAQSSHLETARSPRHSELGAPSCRSSRIARETPETIPIPSENLPHADLRGLICCQ